MTLNSDTDRWLAASLPATLILLLGWFVFLNPVFKERSLLKRRVENMGDPAAKRNMAATARQDLADLNAEASRLRAKLDGGRIGFDRSHAMRRISMLCETHGLQIAQTSVEKDGNRLPAALKAVETKFTTADGQPPQVWRLELAGSYPAVTRLLMDLASTVPMLVPLNVTMETDPKERQLPKWSLYVWL